MKLSRLRYYGYDKKEYEECLGLIRQTNCSNTKSLCAGGLILYTSILLLSSFVYYMDGFQMEYVGIELLIAGLTVMYFLVDHKKAGVLFLNYFGVFIYLLFAMIVALPSPEDKAVIFPVVLVIVPVLLFDDFFRVAVMLIITCGIYCMLVLEYKTPAVAYYDVYDALICLPISFVGHFASQKNIMNGLVSRKNRDILLKEYEQIQQELEKKTRTDELTGLYTRNAFIEETEKLIFKNRNETERFQFMALGILDVDYFKQINDTCGHQTGDKVIQAVANVLRFSLHKKDIIGRLGGDEFIFLLVDDASVANASDTIKGMLQMMNKRVVEPLHGIRASIGIAAVKKETASFDELYRQADMALYESKNAGRNQLKVYEKEA